MYEFLANFFSDQDLKSTLGNFYTQLGSLIFWVMVPNTFPLMKNGGTLRKFQLGMITEALLSSELYFSILSCIQYFVVSGPYTFGFAA